MILSNRILRAEKALRPEPEVKQPTSKPLLGQALAEVVSRYRDHNDKLAERLSDKVQACTIADLELIVRQTHHSLDRALRRLAHVEERLGIKDVEENSNPSV